MLITSNNPRPHLSSVASLRPFQHCTAMHSNNTTAARVGRAAHMHAGCAELEVRNFAAKHHMMHILEVHHTCGHQVNGHIAGKMHVKDLHRRVFGSKMYCLQLCTCCRHVGCRLSLYVHVYHCCVLPKLVGRQCWWDMWQMLLGACKPLQVLCTASRMKVAVTNHHS